MYKNKLFLIGTLILLGVIIGYTVRKSSLKSVGTNTDSLLVPRPKLTTSAGYRVALAQARFGKDVSLKEGKESPIENRGVFKGLKYFDPDTNYCIEAIFEKIEQAKPITIQLTGGQTETLSPLGKATFGLDGKICTLTVFRSAEMGKVFIPFRDTTAPKETYGGGRYLDLPMSAVKGNRVSIDFNLAYNPFCAYNHNFTCPIPPKENHLSVEIRAGEKNF
jgi:uncharacterized protein